MWALLSAATSKTVSVIKLHALSCVLKGIYAMWLSQRMLWWYKMVVNAYVL